MYVVTQFIAFRRDERKGKQGKQERRRWVAGEEGGGRCRDVTCHVSGMEEMGYGEVGEGVSH